MVRKRSRDPGKITLLHREKIAGINQTKYIQYLYKENLIIHLKDTNNNFEMILKDF